MRQLQACLQGQGSHLGAVRFQVGCLYVQVFAVRAFLGVLIYLSQAMVSWSDTACISKLSLLLQHPVAGDDRGDDGETIMGRRQDDDEIRTRQRRRDDGDQDDDGATRQQ